MNKLTLELRPPEGQFINIDALGLTLNMLVDGTVNIDGTRVELNGNFNREETKADIRKVLEKSGISMQEIANK